MFLKKRRNYHKTIHGDAIGIKEIIQYSSTRAKSRFVDRRFSQAKNRVSDWSFQNKAIAC